MKSHLTIITIGIVTCLATITPAPAVTQCLALGGDDLQCSAFEDVSTNLGTPNWSARCYHPGPSGEMIDITDIRGDGRVFC